MTEQQKSLFDEAEENDVLGKLDLERPLVFFDLETTGVDTNIDRIVQFAFIRINPDRTQDEWSELVNPEIPIPTGAAKVHGITDDMVQDKPNFMEFAPKIKDFLQDCDLSGFNVAKFDIPLLQAEMTRVGMPLDLESIRVIDAMTIFHKKEKRDLTAAYRYYCGGEHIDAHDALGDVKVTLEILDAQLKRYSDLSGNMDALHKFCQNGNDRFLTPDRKFEWRDNQAVLTFGKHRGLSLQYLVENESNYLEWMLSSDFHFDTKQLIKNALNGTFPERS